jgi:sugar phosphate isomerase/epimerase
MIEFAICIWAPDVSVEAVDELGAQGVTALEPGPPFLMDCDEATLAKNAERLRAAGISIYSCHAPFGGNNDLSQLDEEKRQDAVVRHVTAIARAETAGAECIVIHPGGRAEPAEHAQRLAQLHRSLATLVPKAEEWGVRLALENMPPHYIGSTTTTLREIVDRVDSPWLGICLDTGHAHLNKEVMVDALRNVRERVIAFHVQDNDGLGDKHMPPPYGTIEWDGFMAELRELGFGKPVAIEAPPWNGASWAVLLREVRALFTGGLVTVDVDGREVWAVCRVCGHYCCVEDGQVKCGCRP